MIRILGINAAILLAGLVIAELIFGSWIFGPSWGTMNIPRDVRRIFDVSGLYGGPQDAVYTRDHWGLRGSYKDLGAIDILTIGGSTTDQRFVGDGQTWQDYLAQDLGGKVVVNAGIDGQSTVGHLRAFDRWLSQIPGLKPRFVLAYIGVNDAHLQGQQQWDDMASPSLGRRVERYITNHSALVQVVSTIQGTLKAHKAHVVHGGTDVPRGPWIAGHPPALDKTGDVALLDAYEQRVAALMGRIRAMGAQAVIVTQSRSDYRVTSTGEPLGRGASPQSVDFGSWAMQTAFNHRAMAACRREGGICLDLGSGLTFEDGDFYDWVHTTPPGNRRIAAWLAPRLAPVVGQ
ncbi:Lysophospholipase L1 [Paramagnetospirillum magnetotacticum MS-1]|uniref:Lysophospholipase L1 n=1 Tax=Paramagnetospirillum magnetotacticum MS-1 TaxID=272627 RepID=A0A0C2UYF2_PARME|nr:SGNH/GDSL hydrolase family protein [Paramagnetospirillum magnetotacticum]KIL97836.1 Lysophospholipase L1 [Paramagnetospirillum magnetotacticum MS-1]